jgi:cytochrome c oxidase subunit 2
VDELLRRILYLPERASTVAAPLDHLHYSVIIVTMGGASLIAIAALYFIIRYGTTDGSARRTARVSAPLWFEVAVVGGLLSLFLLWFQLGYRLYVRMAVSPPGSTEVYVVAKQWMWQFDYASGPSSAHDLYVPAGRPIKLLLTSRDVIHSFFVPDFRIKQDAVPGRYTEAWFEAPSPGVHEILCAEYCGASHSQMRGRVVVLAGPEYDAWAAGRLALGGLAAHPNMAEIGRSVAAEQGCFRCHTPDGTPHLGPTWKDLYGSWETLADGTRVHVDEAYITKSMMDPLADMVAGYQPIMPGYQGRIDAADTAAVVEYMKSLSRYAVRGPLATKGPEGRTPPPPGKRGAPPEDGGAGR